jgi:hypothetical protein
MTLDDLIERLIGIRRACPAAGSATCVGFAIDCPRYEMGEVRFGNYDPDSCDLIEIDVPRAPTPPETLH